ncbi:MAG: N-methylhydantoinase [Sphingomonas bacterium]|uniref:hydantoinase B/oxoprolinase family protein n=1 Tax=Sphingomonas bacterium TaxID=1895847 RepID=UPI0026185AB0|nr:hydantoinase B/oxoprolinase family protein [Sphingomonas bacterium]MDB5710138.1 N-methylhydantoinase [Sphingomonas bacterium]
MTASDPHPGWQFWIDRGGTFTDVIARAPDGRATIVKLLSDDPEHYDDAAVAAIRRLTGIATGPLPAADIRLGTTIATNALLERAGAPTLLAITKGFGDALRIGYQHRPDIFARHIVLPAPLYAGMIEIDQRVDVDGTVLVPLDLIAAETAFRAAHDAGLRAAAIVLVHSYHYPAHEEALADLAARVGFTQISISHRVAPLNRLIARGDTCVVDAYLSPVLRRYVAGLEAALGAGQHPLFMQSNGGLTEGAHFHGKDALLSGPAGGIVGMARTAARAGFDHVIGFDMGGTSTDISLYAGRFERHNDTSIAGVRVSAPMMRIDTVAAGGGSICRFERGRFVVGPESAGAVPGPACYRRGGPLTVTDCNLILGKIQPGHFPRLFGPGGDQPLDRAAAEARLDEQIAASGTHLDRRAAAEGLIAIAVANMARAIKAISVARGHDPARYVLACFGGAGGQHACLVADALGMDRVMIHPLAGVLSAYGMGLAERRVLREASVALALDDGSALVETVAALDAAARDGLIAQGVAADTIRTETQVALRYARTDAAIDVALGVPGAMRAEFEAAFRQRFGFVGDDALVIEALRVEAIAGGNGDMAPIIPLPAISAPPVATVDLFLAGAAHRAPLHDRAGLAPGASVAGPALIIDTVSTTVIEPGWTAAIDDDGAIIMIRHAPRDTVLRDAGTADPVRLEIFAGMFMGLAEEMGAALQRSAASVNIRERLDFSCALFDRDGNLIANAPHIPVHLGSMGESIRTVIGARGGGADGRGMRAGDVYALNAPYRGGTHLPDITVIMPVFVAGGDTPAFFVAARGHHADVGGISPGSMPPDSKDIREEGVLLDNVLVVDAGRFLGEELRALFGGGDWPARNVEQNLADLAAQIAACARGADGLRAMAQDYGLATVSAYMEHVQVHAEAAVRALLADLPDGEFAYEMDDGAVVRVAVRIDRAARTATVDFAGTSAQRPNNFNAPLAVVRAAVLYVLRTLIDADIPLNDGFLRPVTIVVPEGSMLNPRFPAAVVAGNVETSQVVTDALFGALGAMAGSQGTMNNFTFGDADSQYYETIAGGSGAGRGFAGTAVVQTHMTNSRLTDPEVLEARFPVLLEEFSIRGGSGGVGAHAGGDGAMRRVRFRRAILAGILSNRRRVAPFGLAGGSDGAVGENRVERADGTVEVLAATASVEMQPGDVFVIATPGGGGYGRAGR